MINYRELRKLYDITIMHESTITVQESESMKAVPDVFDMNAPLRITHETLDKLTRRTDPETAREVWREAEARELARQDPLILATYIVRTAYRLVREWARTMGVLGYDSALSSLSLDKLLIPMPPGEPPLGPFAISAYAALQKVIDNKINVAQNVPMGLPLMPSYNDHFTPRHQKGYAEAMRHISKFLRLDTMDYSASALPFLIQSPPNPRHWPEPNVLYSYEAALIDEILGIILDKGTRNAESYLHSEHGFLPHEARGLTKLVKFESKNRMEAEVEEDRAILSMRLEDLISRSRECLDLRVELGAIKQLSIVQGVTRAEPADALSEFANVVRKVTNEAKPPIIDALPSADR